MTDETEQYPKPGQSQSGSHISYSVEARYNYPEPKEIAGQLVTKEWKELNYEKGHIGVPIGNRMDFPSQHLGLLNYQAAQALRWWFHAIAEEEILGSLCLETRLVKHKVHYNISEEAISDCAYIGRENSSGQRPEITELEKETP